MTNGNGEKVSLKFLLITISILITISLGLSGFAFKWMFDANSTVKLHDKTLIDMNEKIEKLSIKQECDVYQDATLRKHWKLFSWNKHQINELQYKAGIPIKDWPDLD